VRVMTIGLEERSGGELTVGIEGDPSGTTHITPMLHLQRPRLWHPEPYESIYTESGPRECRVVVSGDG